ncbi:hypothetical protein [Filimonas effusa]|uniref:DUF304 domain-containing protein n=1 Tax=Filimonas effusa TaxID=2508721 RepID=A0A4Q1D9K5_9BACT|nr:hypothetical protein [Filimonas effusa]RXK86077.1 hypothetical protein ESB13_04505 [Filimonas effusa]
MENFLTSAIVGGVVAAFLIYLKGATAKKINANEQGQFMLRMHVLYNIVGWVSLVISLIVVAGVFFLEAPDMLMYGLMLFMFLFFGGLGLLSVLYYRNLYVLFDDSRIEVRDIRGKVKVTTWQQIVSARYSVNSGLLLLTDDEGQKLKIHCQSVGMGKFVAFLEDKTEWTAAKLKLPVKRSV